MNEEGGTQKSLLSVVLVLIVALVVVFVLWQRDQDSKDLNIDIGSVDAGTVVEPGPRPAHVLPDGIEFLVA